MISLMKHTVCISVKWCHLQASTIPHLTADIPSPPIARWNIANDPTASMIEQESMFPRTNLIEIGNIIRRSCTRMIGMLRRLIKCSKRIMSSTSMTPTVHRLRIRRQCMILNLTWVPTINTSPVRKQCSVPWL